MSERCIGHRQFVDGTRRPVYEDTRGQYVLGDEGQAIFGVWLLPEQDDADLPIIVDTGTL